MPFTPPPLVPNFNFGVGRIALDRNDFAAHLEGVNPPYATNFRHLANQIDLVPSIIVNSDGYSTVQSALIAIAANLVPPTVPQATVGTTTANLGVITLGGDVGGTGLVPKVVKLQGVPVTNLAPTNGQVLAYNGTTWTPTSLASTTINISGDVTGTNIASTVVKLQGHAISASVPTTNQLFQYVGGAWTPTSNITLPGNLELTASHTFTVDTSAILNIAGELEVTGTGFIGIEGASAAMYFDSGSQLYFTSSGAGKATWQTGTSAIFNSGATLNMNGQITYGATSTSTSVSGSSAIFNSGATLTMNGQIIVNNQLSVNGSGFVGIEGASAAMYFDSGSQLYFTSSGAGKATWQTGTSATFDSGSTLNMNGELQVANTGFINLSGAGTAIYFNTGAVLAFTAGGGGGGSADWQTGTTATFESGSIVNMNTSIGASTGANVGFTSLTVPLTTLNGATTLTSSQYNRPNLNITASGNLTGTCTLVFPAVQNGIWFVNIAALTTNIGSNTFRVQISGGATVNLYTSGTPVKSFSPIYIVIISNFNIYIT